MAAHPKLTAAARRRIVELRAEGLSAAKISARLADELGVRVSGEAVRQTLAAPPPEDSSPERGVVDAAPENDPGLRPLTVDEAAHGLELVRQVPEPTRLHLLARRAFLDVQRRQQGRTELHDPTLVDQMLERFPGKPPPEALAAAGALRMVIQVLSRVPTEAESATLVKSLSEQLSRNLDVLVSLIPKPTVDPAKDPARLMLRDAVREQVLSYLEPVREKYRRRAS